MILRSVLLSALLSLGLSASAQYLDYIGGWYDFRWGQTQDELKELLGTDWTIEHTSHFKGSTLIRATPVNAERMRNVVEFEDLMIGQLAFVFHGDSLFQIGVHLDMSDRSKLAELAASTLDRLRTRLGPCDRSKVQDHIECEWFGAKSSMAIEVDRDPKQAYPLRAIFRAL